MGESRAAAWVRSRKPADIAVVLVFGLLVVLAIALRFYRVAEPIGGFHSFNEGFYTHLSAVDSQRGAFDWLVKPLDLNNPPLYMLVVSALFRLFGVSVTTARLVSEVAGILVIAFTFEIGRLLYSRRTGLVAALIVSLMPGAVLVSRNAQTDMLSLALALGSVVAYLHAMRDRRHAVRLGVLAGVLLGLACVAKLPGVLVVPGIAVCETIAAKGLGWLRKPRAWSAALAALASSGPWYAYQTILNRRVYGGAQNAIAAVGELPQLDVAKRMLLVEPFWLLGGLAAVAVAAGAVAAIRQRRRSDLLVAAELATVVLFIFVYHYHAYYWTPAIPFLGLAAARGIEFAAARRRVLVPAFTAVVALSLALNTAVTLSGHKWGAWSPQQLVPAVTGANAGTAIDLSAMVYDSNVGPAADVYLPAGSFFREGSPAPAGAKRILQLRPVPMNASTDGAQSMRLVRPVLFGYALHESPANIHFFENGPWTAEKVGPPWSFGVSSQPALVSLVLLEAPPAQASSSDGQSSAP